MEKRLKNLKYLLGLLIVGVGLFINQSFAQSYRFSDTLYVDGVTLPWNDSSMLSSVYSYSFNNYSMISDYRIPVSTLTYQRFIDGVNLFNINWRRNSDCSFDFDNFLFNNSVFGSFLYSGHKTAIHYPGSNGCGGALSNVSNGDGYKPIKVVLGAGDDFGKNFVYVNSIFNDSGVYTPHYGLGGGFLSSINQMTLLNAPDINSYLRLFFRQNGTNLSDPQNTSNFITGYLNSGSIARQYFTPNSAVYRTKNQSSSTYIIDYGREGTKGKHFGGYGMGYSFALNVSSEPDVLQWGNWSFGNIGSRCIESAMNLGVTDFDTLTRSACSSLGLLVLKGDSYVSSSSNASVIILGKNPNNTKQILYEQFDCAEDDLVRIMNNGTGDNVFCNSISHGYIVYSGSSDILPFESKQDTYVIGSGNSFLDFLFTNGLYGYIGIDSNQYCLYSPGHSFCFGLHATPQLISLKEMYLQNGGDIGGIGGTVTGALLDDIIINNPSDYYTYSGLVEYAMQGNFDISEDSSYIDNYLDYTFVNGVPQLKNLKFGVCPFITNSDFATLGMSDFSFDMLVPHKCILAGIQAGYTSVSMSGYDNFNLPFKFINDQLNEQNAGLVGHFVAILIILGVSTLLFYFIKLFN